MELMSTNALIEFLGINHARFYKLKDCGVITQPKTGALKRKRYSPAEVQAIQKRLKEVGEEFNITKETK
jgi:hypothetical protein